MQKRVVVLLYLLMLFGCANRNSDEPRLSLHLLAPSDGPRAVLQQKLTFTTNDQTKELLVAIKLTGSEVKMNGLLPTGQFIYSLRYDGTTVVEDNLMNIPLPTHDMLAMMQFALWPTKAVETSYSKINGWDLDMSEGKRILSRNNTQVLEVEYISATHIAFTHFMHNYNIDIHTLEYLPL